VFKFIVSYLILVLCELRHVDLYYEDGANPTDAILQAFLQLCEHEKGAIAVHCKAGLGRTGTNIAAYMIKHYHYTAREATAWHRICRPGSIVGPQQHYLCTKEEQLRKDGVSYRLRYSIRETPDVVPVANTYSGHTTTASSERRSSRDSGKERATGAMTPPLFAHKDNAVPGTGGYARTNSGSGGNNDQSNLFKPLFKRDNSNKDNNRDNANNSNSNGVAASANANANANGNANVTQSTYYRNNNSNTLSLNAITAAVPQMTINNNQADSNGLVSYIDSGRRPNTSGISSS
jgi:hypothetical protein